MSKITIKNVETDINNAADLKAALRALKVDEAQLSDIESSFLPDGKVMFTSYKIETFKPTEQDDEKVNLVLIATQNNKEFKCSLGKLTAFGTLATEAPEDKESLIETSKKGNKYVKGKSINTFIPSGKHLAIYSLLGKTFDVKAVDMLQLKFGTDEIVSKTVYQLTHI